MKTVVGYGQTAFFVMCQVFMELTHVTDSISCHMSDVYRADSRDWPEGAGAEGERVQRSRHRTLG